MKFNFTEWGKIKHSLEVAKAQYIKQKKDSTESDEDYSCYQIFKRQAEEAQSFIDRIENAELNL